MDNLSLASHSEARSATWPRLIGPALAFFAVASVMRLAALTLSAISVAFPDPTLDPHLVVSAFLLAITALLVPAGRVGDIFGARPVLTTGLALFALGALWASGAASLNGLIAARAVQGIGASAMIGLPLALVRANFPKAKIGRWIGMLGAMSVIGTASVPALGGLIAGSFGWQAVFLLQIPMPPLALAATLLCLPRNTEKLRATEMDLPGAKMLALTLAGGVLLVSSLSGGLSLWHLLWTLVLGLGLALFLRQEVRAPAPLIGLTLIRSPTLALGLICNGLVSVIVMGILVVGPFFLTNGLALSSNAIGLCMAVGSVASV
ncbi:MAG: MFS transporter [Pseudomonadota bacterium]